MAGQPVEPLKAPEDSGPSSHHEARLGIMVITILVFALGFLVYNKVDLHQRKLTQAAITSGARPQQADPSLDATALLANNREKPEATDPLLNRSDLSDGSPFSGPQATDDGTDSPRAFQTAQSEALSDTISQLAVDSTAPEFSLSEPDDSNSFAQTIATEAMHTEAAVEIGTSAQSQSSLANASVPEFKAADSEVSVLEPLDSSGSTFQIDPSATDAPSIHSNETFLQADSEDAVPMPIDASPAAATGGSEFNVPAANESSISFLEPEPVTESKNASASGDEPILLAMAEPQQDSRFSGGFSPDNSSVSIGNAPASQPTDTFPAFDADEQSPTQQLQTPANKPAERNSSFGSQGFNAVTQPGGRSERNSIRTAAGSGSDGKFSLAAFNYQNNSAEPAPDDGSTFESVVVQDGDNYTKISKRVYGTVQYFSALAVFNQHRIREPKSMRPGMVVLTPPKEILEERYPQLFIDSQPKTLEPAEFLVLEDGSPAYRVGERETLSEIAERFLGRTSRWIEIYRLNQSVVKDPNKLKAGLILALPADAAEVSVVP